MKITLAVAAALAALVLTGCSDDSSDKDNGDKTSSSSNDETAAVGDDTVPACEDVWVDGQELDLSSYEGCLDGDTIIAATTSGCYDQKSLEYRGQFAEWNGHYVIQTGTDPKTGQGGEAGTITAEDPAC